MFTCAGIVPPIGIVLSKDDGIKAIFDKISESLKTRSTPSVIFIAGGSASGKTMIAEIIHKKFIKQSILLSQDNYYFGREYSSLNGFNFDQPESIDLDKLKEDIDCLSKGESIEMPIYSFIEDGGKRVGYQLIEPMSLIIVEGLFVLNEKFSTCGGIKVFVRGSCHTRLIRRVIRDNSRTSFDADKTLKYFLEVVDPMHRMYIDKQESFANFILINHYNREIEPEKTCSQKEKQVKVRIKGPLPMKVLSCADKISHTEQEDVYFSISGKSDDEILRIRREGESFLFTYKAPSDKKSSIRTKSKLEFPISSAENKTIQNSWVEKKKIIKSRDLYVLDGIIFSQDYVIVPGSEGQYFLEVRSSNLKKIKVLLGKLGLEKVDFIKESYFEILN